MNVSKQTIKPFDGGSVDNIDLPIIPVKYSSGSTEVYGTIHSHIRAQLIYPCSGLVKVKTKGGIWLISPLQTAWIPPLVEHQLMYLKETSIKGLFIDSHYCSCLNQECCVYDINGLMKELISKAVEIGSDYLPNTHEFRVMHVLLGELQKTETSSLNLPLANDKRVLRVMNYLIKNPVSGEQTDYFSRMACTSSRNLNRLFLHETGLTFGKWRQLLIVLESIELLSKGISVTEISLDMGYQSLSSFVSMFKKITGRTPGNFME